MRRGSRLPAPQFDGGIITIQLRELDVDVDSSWRQSQLDVDLLADVATPNKRPGLDEREVAHQNDGAYTKGASSVRCYDEVWRDLAVHVDGALHLASLRWFWAAVGFPLFSVAGVPIAAWLVWTVARGICVDYKASTGAAQLPSAIKPADPAFLAAC